MTALGVALIVIGLIVVAAIVDLAGFWLRRVRERASRRAGEELVRRRIDDLAAMPAPDELPRSRDVTKAERQRHTYRTAPRLRKRRNGRWA